MKKKQNKWGHLITFQTSKIHFLQKQLLTKGKEITSKEWDNFIHEVINGPSKDWVVINILTLRLTT